MRCFPKWVAPPARIDSLEPCLFGGAYSLGRLRVRVLIDVDFENRRVYVRGRRLHHGLVGAIAVAAGLVAAVHDRRDAKVWVRDFINRG